MRKSLSLLLTIACASVTSVTVSAQIKAQSYDTPSYVQFSAPRYEVSETETNAVVTLVRSGDYRKSASVDYTTREGTASDNVDFKPCGGTIVFAAGESFRAITIPILRGSEPVAKIFQVELAQGDLNTVVTTPTADVEIKPLPPALSIGVNTNGLLVSWADSGTQFTLEALVDGTWAAVQNAPSLDQGVWTVPIDGSAPIALFRLRQETLP
jgi:hypothetical protein